MHEVAIGRRIVDAVLGELSHIQPPPRRLVAIRVVAGRLHQIVPEYLTNAYELLSRDTPAEGSQMQLDVRPVVGTCRACGWKGEIEPPFFRCGDCEAFDIEVVGGKELFLDKLEVEG